MVAVKICGLTRAVDARAAEEAGARFGGVILASGSPRRVDPARVHEIFADSGLLRCGVFVNESRDRVVELAEELSLSVVQLHGDESPDFAVAVAYEAGVEVWKAIRPRSAREFIAATEQFGGSVDGLLLDGWSAAALGGTGVRFPWAEVATHRGLLNGTCKFIAAGGLDPDNVGEVVEMLDPDVVDVSSGVESAPGIKDEGLIRRFAAAALSAAAQKGAG